MSTRYVPAPFGALRISTTDIGVSSIQFLSRCPDNPPALNGTGGDPVADRAAVQLAEYLAGDRKEFELPLDWGGVVSFRRHVLDVLYETVDYGATVTYQELADRSGQPGAARVVGQVMGSNPLPVVVPCHRVTASGGELGGFGGGLETKRWLLELEGSLPPRLPF
jgi:methylated-DNA-[protein]-cysteine S-methyltransferase